MSYGPGAAQFHQQTRLGAVKRVDLRFLVDREHQAVRRRIDVKADDIAQFGGKLGVTAEFEDPQAMRRMTSAVPQPSAPG